MWKLQITFSYILKLRGDVNVLVMLETVKTWYEQLKPSKFDFSLRFLFICVLFEKRVMKLYTHTAWLSDGYKYDVLVERLLGVFQETNVVSLFFFKDNFYVSVKWKRHKLC